LLTRAVLSVNREIAKEEDFPFPICDFPFVIAWKSPNVHWALNRDRFRQ
jgi:hypothetical protein